MIAIFRSRAAGQTSTQYFVHATSRSNTPRRSIMEVIEGCSETTRRGVKSPSWDRTDMTCRQIYNGSMPLSINDPAAEALVRELTVKTGETAEQAVVQSVKERLQRLTDLAVESETNGRPLVESEAAKTYQGQELVRRLTDIALHCASLPDLDTRSADEILGYDENGLPT